MKNIEHEVLKLIRPGLRTPQIIKLSKAFYNQYKDQPERLVEIAEQLVWRDTFESGLAGMTLLTKVYKYAHVYVVQKCIVRLTDSVNWEMRETGAMLIRFLLKKDFEEWYDYVRAMTRNPNVNIRRAALVGSMISKVPEEIQRQLVEEVFARLLLDEEVYIRKNLGPFALSQLLRAYPDLALEYFNKWLKKDKPMITWHILAAFQPARLKNDKINAEAVKLLRIAQTQEKNQKNPDKMLKFAIKSMEKRLNQKGISW